MTISIILFIFSAIFRAMAQTQRFRQPYQSWLYKTNLLTFKTFVPILDAKHFWKGAKEITLIIGAYLLPTLEWWLIPVIIFVLWQIFNLFFHIVFVYADYWEFPFFRLTRNGWINATITLIILTILISILR